ncbi:hypothetical protein KAH81_03335, partial [bacterium]|nr:hypothetical protein [bacterium]
ASHEGFYGNLIISDAVGALVPLRKRNLALGVIYLGGGGINITELPDPSQPVGPDNLPYIVDTKGHHDLALGAAYAYSLNRGISLGASGGGVYRSLIDQKAYGVFVSLGLDWAPIQNMHLGFIVANSSYISWSTGTNELRTPDISTGCSFNKDLGSNFSSKVTAELSYVISGALLEYSVGAGISYKSMVDFMAGLDDGSITAGADFALFPGILIGASMTTHRELPVSYRFGINLYKADSNND